jgi:hypothetical protein
MKKTILILSANPKGTPSLDLDHEIHDIEEEVDRSSSNYKVEKKVAVQRKDLELALLNRPQNISPQIIISPQIVHFCGHGMGEQGLVLENDRGQPQLITTEDLVDLLKMFAGEIECVILNACHSQAQAKEIVKEIDYVVSMKQEILDDAAKAFSVGFYRALAAGRTINFAFDFGCYSIKATLAKDGLKIGDRKLIPIVSPEEASSVTLPEHLKPILFQKEQLSEVVPERPARTTWYILADFIKKDPQVYSALAGWKSQWKITEKQLKLLYAYKSLHKQLHKLEEQCYRQFIYNLKFFPEDFEVVEFFKNFETTLDEIIQETQLTITNSQLLASEVLWIKKLEKAKNYLKKATEELDKNLLEQVKRIFQNILGQDFSPINDRLCNTAKLLPLDSLIEGIQSVSDRLADVEGFKEGLGALIELKDNLIYLVDSHNMWQRIDNILRQIEGTLNKDLADLEYWWSEELQELVTSQYLNCTENWAIALKDDDEKLDSQLKAKSPNPVQIRSAFWNYHRKVRKRFEDVDLDLKTFCDRLQNEVKPLTNILELLEIMQ